MTNERFLLILSAAEAEAQGFTIDRHCWPWLAYKGPRFEPTEYFGIVPDTDPPSSGCACCGQYEVQAKGADGQVYCSVCLKHGHDKGDS